MKQPGLIDCIISAVVLEDGVAKGKYTPSGYVPLVNNEDGFPYSDGFNYRSVVGMMIYFSGHTLPYIDFAVNFFARYIFFPIIYMNIL